MLPAAARSAFQRRMFPVGKHPPGRTPGGKRRQEKHPPEAAPAKKYPHSKNNNMTAGSTIADGGKRFNLANEDLQL